MDFHTLLENLKKKSFFSNLSIARGIEKESLRITKDGFISKNGHPIGLGSSYTNPSITTDFAESLIEMVTPVYDNVDDLYKKLETLHFFINQNLEGEEMLWPFSMPPRILNESSIKIATYGDTNMGKLKHVYRKGLAIRYGKTMQCVAGIHYNFSISKESLEKLGYKNQKDRDDAYLNLIRNFKRLFWFVLIEFGNSSLIDKSFVSGREHDLEELNHSDLYKPHATSLRMSDIGYQSSAQKNLSFKYNDLEAFLSELKKAIINPYPEFKKYGLKDKDNEYHQISSGILQIENELYDCIRPKRASKGGERPYQLLKNQGIQYVEVRGIDLNPHEPVGISKKQIRILDLLLIYCLITPSPQMDNEEKDKIDEQDKNIIKAGKSADAKVWFKGEEVAISSARNELIEELKFIADELSDELYVEAINLGDVYKNKFDKNDSFHEAGIIKAIENVKAINTFTNIDLEVCEKEASDSLKEFDRINQLQEIGFEEFIDSYNSKI